MSIRALTPEERENIQDALALVQCTQTAFWDALGELEGLFDNNIELDGNTDYEGYDVDALLEMEEQHEQTDQS